MKKNFRNRCKLKKNYYLKYFKDYLVKKNIKIKKQILFLDEPFKKEKGNFPMNYFCMKYFIENYYKLKKFKNHKIIIKTHPKQNKSIIKRYLNSINVKNKILIVNNKLDKLIFSSKYVVGITSYALNLASQLKKKTYHCKLPSQKIKLISNKHIMNFYKLSLNPNEKY